jgi:hypothetical protein
LRTSVILSALLPLLALAGCDGTTVKPDNTDTSIGVDDDTGVDGLVADISVSAASLDFGVVPLGTTATQTFTLANEGTGTLESTLSATTGFAPNTEEVWLLAGQYVEVTVSFTATTVGLQTGQLTINSNDPDEATFVVFLGANVVEESGDDLDGDGYTSDTDCNDNDAAVNPGVDEIWYDGVDANCDDLSDYDADGDGHDSADYGGDDCDDSDPALNPDAEESWYDGIDANCDGRSDYDADGDGYDAVEYGGDDCDDTDAAVSPGTLEDEANGIDDDCDGTVDETLSVSDADGDGWTETDGDCNDADATVNPGAAEVWYDGLDQDCSGGSDYDQDGDGAESDAYGGTDCLDTDALVGPGNAEIEGNGLDDDCDGVVDGTSMPDDIDGDGYLASVDDCDDTDGTVNPGATEVWYDGVDQDCSGGSDYDADGDSYDSADYFGTDCDDTDAAVYPGASDTWYDGIDTNCDGVDDYDADGDGQASSAYGGDDCDDTNAAIYLGAAETWYDGVDSDCSGGSDYDQDGDGYDSEDYLGGDCDDTDATIHPGVAEVWYDGVDQDCSGGSDYDQDGDGVTATAYGGFDCDDLDATISPSEAEVCDGVDNDCDGSVDDGVLPTWYADGDSDGYGLTARSTTSCSAPTGYVATGGDCDDSLNSVNPGEAEVCNSRDDDCDGLVDDGITATWYRDADSDGYGNSGTTTSTCSAPAGYVSNADDCDDTSNAVNPAATEVCDGLDQDCDGVADDGTGTTTYYADADSDGYGDASTSTTSCAMPSGYVTTSTDCLDTSNTVYPGATETCNGIDDDCDGTIDDGTGGSTTYYADTDGDGYGDATSTTTSCSAPEGYVTDATDCDDADVTSHPGASEVSYDAADNDCDGYQDDMVALNETDWTVLGELSSDAIGSWGVHVADDLNGDGDGELIVCAGSADYYYSSRYTISDPGLLSFHDDGTSGLDVDLTDGWYEYWGYEEDDALGSSFVVLGDIDGDGYTEIAVGSYTNNTYDNDDGQVYILDVYGESGSDSALSYYADGVIYGDDEDGYFGYSLAAGDFDGDGTPDLATGAPGQQSNRGRVYVTFDGDDLGTDLIDDTDSNFYVNGVSSNDYLGYDVAFGDFNDDGYDDLVASSPYDDDGGSNAGTAWIIAGASTRGSSGSVRGSSVSSVDTAVITGSAASDTLGGTNGSLSTGDIDDDGVVDLAVGVYGYDGYTSGGGGVWIYRGGTLSGSETVSTASYVVRGDGYLGYAVDMTGDVTGDGIVDLLAGAPAASSYGMVYLWEGGQATGTYTLPTDQYASWLGEASSDYFGASLSGLLDLDGDGRSEFAVSASGNDDGASGGGKVYVIPAYP